jgi:hypothetical protein
MAGGGLSRRPRHRPRPPRRPRRPSTRYRGAPAHRGAAHALLPSEFADAQWTSIVERLDGDLASGKRLRAVKLANGDEPDFIFRPEDPMTESGLLYLPVRELAARIRSRRLSPVALTELSLSRLETLGPKLNAVVTVMRESALREAHAAEAEIARAVVCAARCTASRTA